MSLEIKLPELGDNINSGIVVSVFVNEGDPVAKEQALIELETDKAVIEVPSSDAGVVKKLHVKTGDEVKIGQVIAELDSNGAVQTETKKTTAAVQSEKKETPKQPAPSPAKKTEPKVAEASKISETVDFKIPNMGDNVESGTVTSVLVKVGDSVKVDQGLVELETDKAVIEVPADVSGVIKEILLKEGDTVKVGQKVFVIESADAEPTSKAADQLKETVETKPEPAEPEVQIKPEAAKTSEAPMSNIVFEPVSTKIAPASPSVRRFAREIGVVIHDVAGSGPGGRISIEDVKMHSKLLHQQKGTSFGAGAIQGESLPDFSKWGAVEKGPLNKLRQTSARHLSYAWASIPHVTQHDKADITDLEKLRKANGKKAEAAGGKLTMTAILIKVIAAALQKFPDFNASIDLAKNEIIYKKYINIGIAVDTERGLLVPVVQDADKKNIIQLSVELTDLSQKARDKKLALEDMQGGNFSISNLGGIGGTGFTPIVNAPEVAILGVSRAEMEPKFIEGKFEPRLMMPLALSYDHRIIDGAAAAKFLRWVCEVLEEPFNVLLEG